MRLPSHRPFPCQPEASGTAPEAPEAPEAAEVEIDAATMSVEEGVKRVLTTLEALNLLPSHPGQAPDSEEAFIRERLRSLGYVE